MKTTVEIKADILKTTMLQDRQEIQQLRSSVYNVISSLTVASFALSSWLFASRPPVARTMRLATDLLMIVFIWVIFLKLKRDVGQARIGLKFRQNLITDLGTPQDHDELNVFANPYEVYPDIKRDIKDNDLYWIPLMASAIILSKAGLTLFF